MSNKDWAKGIVKLAMNAYKAGQPCDICFGTVTSLSPLTVSVEDLKLPLTGNDLIVPDYLQERTITVTLDGKTGTGIIPGAFRIEDHVILAMKTGGQRYVIIGRRV